MANRALALTKTAWPRIRFTKFGSSERDRAQLKLYFCEYEREYDQTYQAKKDFGTC